MKLFRLLGMWLVLLICCLVGFVVCLGCSSPIKETIASLAVDPPVLDFSGFGNEKPLAKQRALLFLEESEASAIIDSVELEGSKAFRLLTQFQPPFRLAGGKFNGIQLEVGFTPDGQNVHEGQIRIRCATCAHREGGQSTFIKLRYRALALSGAVPIWSCGAIAFGDIPVGQQQTKRCRLTNTGERDLEILSHQYKAIEGAVTAFQWLSPLGALTVKAGDVQGVEVEINFVSTSNTPSSGTFVFDTRTPLAAGSGSLDLSVSGNRTNARSPTIELVPVYPTCISDSSCRTIDKRLSCVDESFSGARICRTSGPGLPLLKFPLTLNGKVAKRTFWVRSTGDSPLTIDHIRFDNTSSKDFKLISTGFSLPLTLAPKQQKEVTIEYAPSNGNEDTGRVIASSNAKGMPSAEMLVEASTRGCLLQVQPWKLRFRGTVSQQVVIQNRGNEACTIQRVYLKSGKSVPFAILSPPLNQVLAPSGSLSVQVTFAPTSSMKVSDILVVESNESGEPVLEVDLEGGGNIDSPCELHALPSSVLFGPVDVGRSQIQSVTFSNRGLGECDISALRVMGINPAVNTAFQVVSAVTLPAKISSGSSIQLDVSYTPPGERALYEGELEIQSNDYARPSFQVKLSGSALVSCLDVVPPQMDFGATKFGCATATGALEVFHTGAARCPASISVTGIQMAQPVTGEFRVERVPVMPHTLTAGPSMRIELSYKAKDLGVDIGVLEIANSISGQPPARVRLVGNGVANLEQNDAFQQSQRPMVDVAWIIDNSRSMAGPQAELGANGQSFLNWAMRNHVDYQILVTTTDVTGVGVGCAQGGTRIITPNTPDPSAAFVANTKVGTAAKAKGHGLEAAYRMLTSPALTGCNQGFLRSGAALSLVFVSDGKDLSARTVHFYISFLQSLKGPRRTEMIRASAIVGPLPSGCFNGQTASAAPRYIEVSKQLNGVQASICAPWAATMSTIGSLSFGFRTQFSLSRKADATTIVVKVNGNVVKEDAREGWQFDATTNSIVFGSSATPSPGSTIQVVYQSACLP